MPKVTFLPMNLTFESQPGDSVLDVAVFNDVPIEHACGGFCACTTCHVKVKSGAENISPMQDEEDERTEYLDELSPESRLACQCKVLGDVTVEVVNIDE